MDHGTTCSLRRRLIWTAGLRGYHFSASTQHSQQNWSRLVKLPCKVTCNALLITFCQGQMSGWHVDDADVCFFNGVGMLEAFPQGPQLAHFRSTNISNELEHIKLCCKNCLNDRITLPLAQLRLQEEVGRARYVAWPPPDDDQVTAETPPSPPSSSHNPCAQCLPREALQTDVPLIGNELSEASCVPLMPATSQTCVSTPGASQACVPLPWVESELLDTGVLCALVWMASRPNHKHMCR